MVVTFFILLYHNQISDQIGIDLSVENNRKLLVAAAHTCGNALSVITEFSWLIRVGVVEST